MTSLMPWRVRSAGDAGVTRRVSLAVEPSTLWKSLAALLMFGLAAIIIVALLPREDGSVDLAEPPADVTAAVTPAGHFPSRASERLRNPRGIAVSDSRVYVAEADAGVVRVFTLAGGRVASIPVPPAPGTRTAYPVSVAALPGDRIAVVDTAGSRVVILGTGPLRGGRVLGVLGVPGTPGAMQRPTSVVFEAGRVLVADAGDRTIHVFGDDGRSLGSLGAELMPQVGFVGGMAVGFGKLWVCDSTAGRVRALSFAGGKEIATVTATFRLPRGIAVGGGWVMAGDTFEQAVVLLSPAGDWIESIGPHGMRAVPGRPPEPGLRIDVGRPEGLAWHTASDRLYVTDAEAGVVQVLNVRPAGVDR